MSKRDFKPRAVMLSKRANVFYLQRARICVEGDRVVYWSPNGDVDLLFNIPDKNTVFVLLGKGTSITDAAARLLAESGVLIGFCGTGGSPLFSVAPPVFIEPVSEYRPTEYMQKWIALWMDEVARLDAAKALLQVRIKWTADEWARRDLSIPVKTIERFQSRIDSALNTTDLLTAEAEWAKSLYGELAGKYKLDFKREEGKRASKSNVDVINGMIDHGNYIAYGYAAVTLTTLGISYAFPLLHGKTRRGALVFDIADLFKDGIIMTMAFEFGSKKHSEQDFRDAVTAYCFDSKLLDHLFDTIISLVENCSLKINKL